MILMVPALAGLAQDQSAGRSLVKARYLVTEKAYADAVAILNDLPVGGSASMPAALAMGEALSGLGKFDESNVWLMKVTGVWAAEANWCLAKNWLNLNNLPNAVLYLGKHLADKNHFAEKFVRLDPDFTRLENSREWVHLWQTEWYTEFEQRADEVSYLVSQGQLDDALNLANQAIADAPNDPRAWFQLARIGLLEKQDRQYRQALDKAWQLSPGLIVLREEMLRFALEAGNYEKVNAMAGELIREDPSNPEYLITRALVRILEGKESMAMKEIEATEEEGIAPAELYYQAGRKISATMPQQAESYLTKAISTGRMDARYYYERGKVRLNLEETATALDDLAMSLDINPNQPDLYMERAQIRLDLGDGEGACHDWKRAMEMGNKKAPDLLYKYCRLP